MNFQDLLQKMKNIEEGVEEVVAEPAPTTSNPEADLATGAGASDESVTQECGMMPSMGSMMPQSAPAQQDTVSMNVSMNAQGAGGIRDLMNVLKDIQDGPDGSGNGNIAGVMNAEPHGVEIDADPELDIAMPADAQHDADDQVMVIDKEEDEAYANEPGAQYQSSDYMNNTLAGGADEPQKMTKGGYNNTDNALTMAAILPVAAAMGRMGESLQESLVGQLSAMYEEVKTRKEKEPEGLYSSKRFETDGQRIARLAKEKRQAEKKSQEEK